MTIGGDSYEPDGRYNDLKDGGAAAGIEKRVYQCGAAKEIGIGVKVCVCHSEALFCHFWRAREKPGLTEAPNGLAF
ncbi:MAG: hypothetical protein WEK74_05400 [Hydrogenophaga sp.]